MDKDTLVTLIRLGAYRPNTISIYGKRWFQRSFGSTYHSCRVFIDGIEVGYAPYKYGYGEQYMHTAVLILQELGIIEHGYKYPYPNRFFQDNGINSYTTCEDVPRKRDL